MPGSGCVLVSCTTAKINPKKDKGSDNARIQRKLGEVNSVAKRRGRTHDRRNPQGPTGTSEEAESEKGVAQSHGNVRRCRNMAWGADMSSGGWQVVGAGVINVGGALHQERGW